MPRLFTAFGALDALESEYQGGKRVSRDTKGLGTGFVATVNTCQGVVLFETRSVRNPLVRNLPKVGGASDDRDS